MSSRTRRNPSPLPLSPMKATFTLDRKSTRLNSSHTVISYAVFCLKKKKKQHDHVEAENAGENDKARDEQERDDLCCVSAAPAEPIEHRRLSKGSEQNQYVRTTTTT